jgi:hypothetical protein
MYRTPVIIGKIRLIFNNDRRRSIYYPAYPTATCQNKKNISHGVSFYNWLEIVCQSCWRRLPTEDAGVDKLPDYLRSDTKDVIRGKKSFVFLDSGQLYLATVNYQI